MSPDGKSQYLERTCCSHRWYGELVTGIALLTSSALCICAEQTFSDGFAERGTFAHAFERAFITYISSASKSEVESAIKALALQDDEVDEGDEDEDDQDREKSRLKHIITKHRLRIPKETA
ncbi:hypothetical protein B0H11DRAFT_2225274 [Mycena galericulata]|nr:hypothetical protein B0H11DRAFT_2225274 [Mycena galericulata]